jgi:hypothetical protein
MADSSNSLANSPEYKIILLQVQIISNYLQLIKCCNCNTEWKEIWITTKSSLVAYYCNEELHIMDLMLMVSMLLLTIGVALVLSK